MVSRSHWLALLLMFCSLNLQAAVESQVNRNTISQGESIRFTIDMSGVDGDNINLNPLQKDFEILGRSQQSRTLIRNGKVESSNELVLSLLPRRTGVLTIPSLDIDGEQTQSHQLEVKAVAQPAASEGGLEMSATLSSEQPRVQQPLIYRMQLQVGQAVFNASLQGPTIASGMALVEPLGEQQQFKRRVNGREITVVEQAWLITPELSGELEISPAMMVAQVRTGRRKRDSFGSSLFSDPYETRRVQVNADGFRLQVEPIPAEYSARYWLPATALTLNEQWSSEQFKAGEPLTRTITLRAEGLAANQLPQLSLPESAGLKQYAANPETDQDYQDGVLSSTLTQEVTLIPGRAGALRLPALEVTWWNLASGKVEVARLPARELTVLAGEAGQAVVLNSEPETAAVAVAASGQQASVANNSQAEAVPEAATDSVPAESAPVVANIAQSGQAAAPETLWIALAGAGAGSAGTLLLLWGWRRWQQRQSGTGQPVDSAAGVSARQSLQALKKACQENDPAAAREALLEWAQCYWPRVANLHQLSGQLSPELQHAINDLNRSSYSRSPKAWQGQRLLAALKAFEPPAVKADVAKGALEPLYAV